MRPSKRHLFICSILWLPLISGHGRLIDPPSRSSMWRLGFDNPRNYNDMELFCGGFYRQFSLNGGKCGLCGDPWDAPSPRDNEAGGTYANGIIAGNYTRGQILTAKVELTAHHKGYFEFRVCPALSPDTEVTQDCLDDHLLPLADGTGARYYLPHGSGNGVFEIPLQLPPHLACERCVFQWIYSAGNNWGRCDNGTEGVGCGNQEQFRGCADISIFELGHDETAGSDPLPRPMGTKPPKKKKKKKNKSHKKKTHKHRPSQDNDKNQPSTTSPITSERPLLRGSGVILTGLDLIPWGHDEHPGPQITTTTTAAPPPQHNHQLVQCISVGAFAKNPSITQWCTDNCLHTPPFCPSSHCKCHYISPQDHHH